MEIIRVINDLLGVHIPLEYIHYYIFAFFSAVICIFYETYKESIEDDYLYSDSSNEKVSLKVVLILFKGFLIYFSYTVMAISLYAIVSVLPDLSRQTIKDITYSCFIIFMIKGFYKYPKLIFTCKLNYVIAPIVILMHIFLFVKLYNAFKYAFI